MDSLLTHNLGFPRIGERRELKRALEGFWQGRQSREDLEAVGRELRRAHWERQRAAGIDLVPCNDFSFYDHMLDVTCLVGNVPARFGAKVDADTAFRIARGMVGDACCGAPASDMTKWFDTNYHYIVPELGPETRFHLAATKVFDEFVEAQTLGFRAKPVLVGPLTYLLLGKAQGVARLDLLEGLLAVYAEVLRRLAALGAEWVQLDEPVLALDLDETTRAAFAPAYARLASAAGSCRLLVATYFGPLRENLATLRNLPVAAIHVDATRGAEDLDHLFKDFPADKILSLGVVDGRNVWRSDFSAARSVLERARAAVGDERLWLAPSCSLLHVPVSLAGETKLDPELRSWLAFADEKLAEVVALRGLLRGESQAAWAENEAARASRRESPRIHDPAVQRRLAEVRPADFARAAAFPERQVRQREKLRLPLFPTTTIGSFPQTPEVRAARAKWKRGELPTVAYESYLRHLIEECVAFQDGLGIDLPVHGEFERNDMVEYFGEQLAGFAFTENGWVQSYGSRCVKPPLIFGDVSRPRAMTVAWSSYAQSLTKRPLKGMLTGPVTILQWSFVRDDQPRDVTARQIALAIRDEVLDLERAGLAAIQIDEPAFREGLPLRRAEWPGYLEWAAAAFRLSASGVRDETQIHTHMCYSEFNDIIEAIAALDADVITIETSRSQMALLEAFVDFRYPNEIGPGVWDIHSPRVPSAEEMVALIRKAAAVLPRENLWVNPDCGLKTRGWPEVRAALANLVEAARRLRAE